jgi:hypothetical protein
MVSHHKKYSNAVTPLTLFYNINDTNLTQIIVKINANKTKEHSEIGKEPLL